MPRGEVDGTSLWRMVTAAGLWDAGRQQSVYAGYPIDAMQHGLDRIATLLKAHPEMLSEKVTPLFTLVDVAQKLIVGEIDPIQGSRRICRLRFRVGDGDNAVFNPFIGIDSESGDVLVANRALWADEFLDDIDRRYVAYDRSLRPGIRGRLRRAAGRLLAATARMPGGIEYETPGWRRRCIEDGMPFRRPPAPPGRDPVAQMRAAKVI